MAERGKRETSSRKKQEDQAEMQQFTRKAAADSYIGRDCLMAVSMVRLLMVEKKKFKSLDGTRIHPPVLLPVTRLANRLTL